MKKDFPLCAGFVACYPSLFRAVARTHKLSMISVLLFTVWFNCLFSQDLHFSQFYNAPLYLNPALTGVTRADTRAIALYRSQWQSANSPYKTVWASAENRYYRITHDTWWMSSGLNLFYDQAGDSRLTTTGFSLSGSYTRQLGHQNFLSAGFSAGLFQRRFDISGLTFDNQWNGDIFDSNRNIRENFDDPGMMYPDFSIGANWRTQAARKRTKIDFGVAAFHFTRPNQSFQGDDPSRLPVRFSLYALPVVQVSEKVDATGGGTYQTQGPNQEFLLAAAGRLHLSRQKSKEVAVQLGLTYRFHEISDALIPAAELHYHQWVVGFTWDINISKFSTATNRNGGPEIAVQYLFRKVQPLRAFKSCPLI